MKVGLVYVPPLWFAAARVLLGALCLFAVVAVVSPIRLPGAADVPVVLSVAGLQIALFLALVNTGLQNVDAGRAAILTYTTPLWVVPIARFVLGERPRRFEGWALLLGLTGIAVLFSPRELDFTDPQAVAGNALLLAAALLGRLHRSYSAAYVAHEPAASDALADAHRRRRARHGRNGGGTGCGYSLVGRSNLGHGLQWTGGISFLLLGHVTVARALPAVTTSLASLGVPVIGVLSSALALDEALSLTRVAGLLLITSAIALLNIPRRASN